MAVYWCDPYIDAPIGSIHGTTDTTTRSGTYSAPWTLRDLFSTASNNNTNLSGLSNGDEIRLKGLSLSTYLIDAGTDFYVDTSLTIKKASAWSSAVTSAMADHPTGSGGTNYGCIWMVDKTTSDQWCVADSDGNKPPIFFLGYLNTDSSPAQQIYNNSYNSQEMLQLLTNEGTTSGSATLNMKLLNPEYYLNDNTTGNDFFACYDAIGIKVTDGWTSETVRDGYTILGNIRSSSQTTARSIFFNRNGNGLNYADTLYDMPSTYWVFQHNTSGYTRQYVYFSNCKGSYAPHQGKDVVHRIGGMVQGDGGIGQFYVDTSYWYNSAYSSTSSDSVNSFEINHVKSYYGMYTRDRYGDSNSPATYRFNNAHSGRDQSLLTSSSSKVAVKIGTVLCNYISSTGYNFMISNNTASVDTQVNVLDGAYFFCRGTQGGGVFRYKPNLTFDGTAYNYENGSLLANAVSVTTGGWYPQIAGVTAPLLPYTEHMKLNPTDWTTSYAVVNDSKTTGTSHYNASENVALGVLDVGSGDYTTDNFNSLVKVVRSLYGGTATTGVGIAPIHFSGNTQDGRPIGLLTSYSGSLQNKLQKPVIYYNDQNKSDALCFKCNTGASNNSFVQRIEQQMPVYETGQTVTFTVNLETESTFTTAKAVHVLYLDNNGELATTQLFSSTSAVTTATNYSANVSAANMYQTTNGAPMRHCKFVIDFVNEATNGSKMWIHSMSVSVA